MIALEVDEVARWIGAGGLIVAAISVAWQIWQYLLSRARVKVRAHWGIAYGYPAPDTAALIVDVRNVGGAPVDIQRIDIEVPGGPWVSEQQYGPDYPARCEPGSRLEYAFRESDIVAGGWTFGRVRPLVHLTTGTVRGPWCAAADARTPPEAV